MLINISKIGSIIESARRKYYLRVPDGFNWIPPFSITNNQGIYNANFSIDTYRPATSIDYYVDPVNGNDSNDGLTASTPKRNMPAAITLANTNGLSCRFLLKPASYRFTQAWNDTALTVSAILEPWATGDLSLPENTVLFINRTSALPISWLAYNGETYSRNAAASATDPPHIVDTLYKDQYGSYLRYTKATDEANCLATRGTWWRAPGTSPLLVHAIDGRNLVGSTSIEQPMTGGQGNWAPTEDNAFLWMRNIAFFGGLKTNPAVGKSAKIYGDRLIFECSGNNGYAGDATGTGSSYEAYFTNSVASWSFRDGFNYHCDGVGASAKVVEINCKAGPNGMQDGGTTNNASTFHEIITGVSVGCVYAGSQNRTIHDIQASQRWLVNCTIGASQASDITSVTLVAGLNDTAQSTRMWLDGCILSPSIAATIEVKTGCIVNYTNMNVDGLVKIGAGDFSTYVS